MGADIPEKVKRTSNREIERRIDLEFMRRVEEESDRKASENICHEVEIEWPNWFRANVKPKVMELEGKIHSDAFKLLEKSFPITCDKCSLEMFMKLTPQGIGMLLRNGFNDRGMCDPQLQGFPWKA